VRVEVREAPAALAIALDLTSGEPQRVDREHGRMIPRSCSLAVVETVPARLAAALERGALARPAAVARALERAWAFAARGSVVRELRLGPATRVVAVGGSGKTPVALACTLELARRTDVVLVGHAYGAWPGRARLVRPDDEVAAVGDEALACARALDRAGARRARVVVAPRRQDAVAFAERLANFIVLDGVAQTSPRRADLALLALDAASPWGRGRVPPSGDLRAPRGALLAACDRTVVVGDEPGADVRVLSRGALLEDDRRLGWRELADGRIGLFTAIARPWRIVHLLARQGILPVAELHGGDHRAPAGLLDRVCRLMREKDVHLWLATPKCVTHLEELARRGIPVGVLDDASLPSDDFRRSLRLLDFGGAVGGRAPGETSIPVAPVLDRETCGP
jgi:tetraacyldisaccharide 4'-kinase